MNRLRFYLSTPDSDREEAMRRIASALHILGVRGATITPGLGLWQSAMEPAYVVEILQDVEPGAFGTGLAIAKGLREAFGQDAVILTVDRVMAWTEAKKEEVWSESSTRSSPTNRAS